MSSGASRLAVQSHQADTESAIGPKLLVSVRNAAEARDAVRGGADIIDVKEPGRGSLGMANPELIASVLESVRADSPDLPVSAALGELLESRQECRCLPAGLGYVKLGLAGASGWTDWRDSWRQLREGFQQNLESPLNWVGVAYADAETADAPRVDDVIAASTEAGCAGVLIDTFAKSNGRLLDLIGVDQLVAWADCIRASGMFLALAGQIQRCDLSALTVVPIDIIAVRSAVCAGNLREAELSADLVAAFRRELDVTCGSTRILRSRHSATSR